MTGWLFTVGKVTGAILSVSAFLTLCVRIVFKPLVVKPLGRLVRSEVKQIVEEIVVNLFASLAREYGRVEQRLDKLDKDMDGYHAALRNHLAEHGGLK